MAEVQPEGGAGADAVDLGGELNPAQLDIVNRLGAAAGERPRFDTGLRHELRAELEDAVAEAALAIDPAKPLRIAKHALAGVHSCEARWIAGDAEEFVASVPVVRGTVVHKSIELSVHWPPSKPMAPLDLVDAAVESLTASDHWVSDFLATATAATQAELRSEVGELVTKFLETWPPLPTRWTPVTETDLWVDLANGRIKLKGVVDLTLGRARGDQAGKVVIDLKTGGFVPGHVEDLRFYALLDTLRVGVPPRLLASYYLDAGFLQPEPVTADLLWATVARVGDGVRRMVELKLNHADANRRPSPACRWCPLREDCEPGQMFLNADDDPWR